jgi:hypothetical protein
MKRILLTMSALASALSTGMLLAEDGPGGGPACNNKTVKGSYGILVYRFIKT